MNHLLSLTVLLSCLALTGCSSPRMTDAHREDIRSIAMRSVEADGIVGLSIGIAINGRTVYAEGFGHADAGRTIPMQPTTIFDIASVGKQFTAAAVLKLVDRGDLSLDQRVRSLVPELPPHFPDATIEQLLRHTSGFVSGSLDEQAPPAWYSEPQYGLDLLRDVELQTGKVMFREDEMFVYANAGYLVLGLVVEAASGMRYDDFIREEVLAPLEPHDMRVCEYAPSPRGSQRLHRTPEGVAAVPFIHISVYGGQGSICSSVKDLLRWSRALNEGRIISQRSLRAFRTPGRLRGNEAVVEIPYGMAQRIGDIGGFHKVSHTGTFDGGSAMLAYYPEAGLEIAVLSNTRGDGTPHAHAVETEIAKLLLGVPVPDVESERVGLSAAQKHAIAGTYTHGTVLEATFEGDDLVVIQDGKETERLVHIGDMRFRMPDRPDVFEWFLMDGERAGWWVYSVSGNYVDVVRRVDR